MPRARLDCNSNFKQENKLWLTRFKRPPQGHNSSNPPQAVRDVVVRDVVVRDVVARDAVVRDAVVRDAVVRDAVVRDAVVRDVTGLRRTVVLPRIWSRR